MGGGVGYFYFIIKGKITLSFASPEKENLYIYIYDVITWKKFVKRSVHYYWWAWSIKSLLRHVAEQYCIRTSFARDAFCESCIRVLPAKLGTILRWPCTALVAFSPVKLFATNPAVFRPFTPKAPCWCLVVQQFLWAVCAKLALGISPYQYWYPGFSY